MLNEKETTIPIKSEIAPFYFGKMLKNSIVIILVTYIEI